VKEIDAQAIKEKKDADDQFTNHQLENQLRVIEQQTELLNAPLQSTASNPIATLNEKYKAQQQIFTNTTGKILQELARVDDAITRGTGNIDRLRQIQARLWAELDKNLEDSTAFEEKHLSDVARKLAGDISAVAGALHGLAASLKDSNPELSKFLDTLASVGDIASQAASAIAGFASGNIAGGISSSIGFVTGVINLLNKGREERKKQQQELDDFQQKMFTGEQEINLLYRERAREQAKINDLKLVGLSIEHQTLEEQRKANAKQFQDVLAEIQKLQGKQVTTAPGIFGVSIQAIQQLSLAGKSFDELEQLFLKGQLEGKAKELFETLQKLKQEGVDIDALLKSNTEEAKQVFTGTTAESITDSIVDGFKNGLRSASDFADTFQDLMQNAILQSLKFQALEAPLKKFFDEFAASSESDQVLTEDEIAQLRQNFNNIIQDAGQKFDELQRITNLSFTGGAAGGRSLTGAIKGMTEETAGLIAGQFGGFRLTALDQLRVASQSLDALNEIRLFTSNLVEMRNILSRFEAKGIHVF
jgi:hypothetical protein